MVQMCPRHCQGLGGGGLLLLLLLKTCILIRLVSLKTISHSYDEQMFPPNLGTVESVDFHISIISILGQLNFNILRLKSDM